MTHGLSRTEILTRMHDRLDQSRFDHCVRVEAAARDLAVRFGLDVDRAGLAGLLHDYAKQVPVADYLRVIQREDYSDKLLRYNRGIWHGVVGTYFIRRELGIDDAQVLQAIERHTTGNPHMTPLDMTTFVADYIEPLRHLPMQVQARRLAQHSLTAATIAELQGTLTYLIGRHQLVYPLTLKTFNALVTKENK
ncbi:hypothetical protein FD19_GL000598 [Lacticaseibacillus thailandensis DSM 22698 = JCM 13996]|uniref:bis(5'-nucleosyl)-tetraphosphatase (symmetrical) n=1 Tax=Lacticaseibacillus thailandensis DSM 22698 = JCM 13996 TaxID=1423810 RepID=A0A0R2CAA1_9LACO|nr:hypothetical protein FD19_GL000598 [Lacticaseibacillus thailandensis DSM 22698 = JCM 13996]